MFTLSGALVGRKVGPTLGTEGVQSCPPVHLLCPCQLKIVAEGEAVLTPFTQALLLPLLIVWELDLLIPYEVQVPHLPSVCHGQRTPQGMVQVRVKVRGDLVGVTLVHLEVMGWCLQLHWLESMTQDPLVVDRGILVV